MKHFALLLALTLASPALAQDSDTPPEGEPLLPFLDRFTERSESMMRDLLDEIGPEMEALMNDLLPELQRLGEALGGFINYEMPEILPNGDIIIRRKPDAPPLPEDFLENNQPIEL